MTYEPFTHQHGISAKWFGEVPPDQRDRQDAYQLAHPVEAQVVSPFAGRGIFTTSDAGSASGHPCDWVAVQMDPEGDQGVIQNNPARLCYWQARPTQEVVDLANERGVPFIGQAESQAELERCLAMNVRVPKAIVGNAGSWGWEGRVIAADCGWDLIQEWYWQAHPWETAPDADHYPRFVNVCFGIYSEGEPGGEGYVPQSKSVADYRAVWPGSFSVWKAEAMTSADWVAFDARVPA